MAKKPKFQQKKDSAKATDASQVEQFVEDVREEDKGRYPWQSPDVREDKKQMVPLYLTEPYKEKLKYISDQTGIPQQRILRDLILPVIDEKIKELTGE